MTTLSEPVKTARPSAFAAIAGIVALRVKTIAQRFKNRRDAALLAGLDDHMLADIGLTRGDLRDAFSEPLWRDPTAVLVSRANERRRHRRGGVFGLPIRFTDAPSIVPHAVRASAACSTAGA